MGCYPIIFYFVKIAILGSGYAGISIAWYLCQLTLGSASIDVFDPDPAGVGASRVSLGILNPFMGKQARLSWAALPAIAEVHHLLTESGNFCRTPLIVAKGLFRPANGSEQQEDFQARAIEFPDDVKWWNKADAEKAIAGLHLPESGGGLYIPKAVTIRVDTYLDGLKEALSRQAVQFISQPIFQKEKLERYDKVFFALGASSLGMGMLKDLPITPIKGQIIQLKWPKDRPPLCMSLSGEGQMVMAADYQSCYVGATYEKSFKDSQPNIALAHKEILAKMSPIYPSISQMELIDCRSRVRAASKTHRPLLGKVDDRYWFMTGLGSKGLLYHAFAAKQLALAALKNDPSLITPELFCPYPVSDSVKSLPDTVGPL
jgi:glycine/D-amino acid oxidase-like deaminating enzyme